MSRIYCKFWIRQKEYLDRLVSSIRVFEYQICIGYVSGMSIAPPLTYTCT